MIQLPLFATNRVFIVKQTTLHAISVIVGINCIFHINGSVKL
jgi:hypothetical protein